MKVVHRDLSQLASRMAGSIQDARTRSMLGEMSDRYTREPDKEVETAELYKQALRMTEFGPDGGSKIKLGRAAMQYLSERTACQASAHFCLQVSAAVSQYDSELAVYRTALKQPDAFESNNVARLGLEMMHACERFQVDHAKIGELACRALSDQPAASQALKDAAFNRTHNQDARLYKEALQGLASGVPAPVAAPEGYVSRLDRTTGLQQSYDTLYAFLGELGSLGQTGQAMLDKCTDARLALLAGRLILEDADAGKKDELATMSRLLQTVEQYPHSPIDKGNLAELALCHFKGKLEHEPLISMSAAAAASTTTYLAQLKVAAAALGGLSENPRPGPGVLACRLVDAAETVRAKSASRAGQAAVSALAALYDTPTIRELASGMDRELEASDDYHKDLPIIRRTLQGITALPEPARGSLLALAQATAGLGEKGSIGEQNGAMVVGGVRLRVKKRLWETEE